MINTNVFFDFTEREDVDGRGKIKTQAFVRVVEKMEFRLTPVEVDALVGAYGRHGLVDYEEYLKETGGEVSWALWTLLSLYHYLCPMVPPMVDPVVDPVVPPMGDVDGMCSTWYLLPHAPVQLIEFISTVFFPLCSFPCVLYPVFFVPLCSFPCVLFFPVFFPFMFFPRCSFFSSGFPRPFAGDPYGGGQKGGSSD